MKPDARLMAAIMIAIDAYIQTEQTQLPTANERSAVGVQLWVKGEDLKAVSW